MRKKIILSRIFTHEDQLEFAEFSGDVNPIHIDPVYSRRTIVGECIVHGVHGFLCAINSLLEINKVMVSEFKAKFLKPIPLNVLIHVALIDKRELHIIGENNVVYTTIRFTDVKEHLNDYLLKINKANKLLKPLNLNIDECSNLTGADLAYCGNQAVGENLFPKLLDAYGSTAIIEIVCTSEVVGMRCPGLRSLFLSMSGKFINEEVLPKYRVLEIDKRFGFISLLFEGRRLNMEAKIFYQRTPLSNSSTNKINQVVVKNNFRQVKALVIGGSRGIGEVVAKMIAHGGGKVTITFDVGEDDARRVQQEIASCGGDCHILQLTIDGNISILDDDYNQIYYFASPKIKKEDKNIVDKTLIENYNRLYVIGFKDLINKISEGKMKCNIFYPSTIFLDATPNGYWGYSEAKAKGEQICREFNEDESIHILYSRLPRLATDQNMGLIGENFPDIVDVLYPLISKMMVNFGAKKSTLW